MHCCGVLGVLALLAVGCEVYVVAASKVRAVRSYREGVPVFDNDYYAMEHNETVITNEHDDEGSVSAKWKGKYRIQNRAYLGNVDSTSHPTPCPSPTDSHRELARPSAGRSARAPAQPLSRPPVHHTNAPRRRAELSPPTVTTLISYR
ncbi:hypothetical protein Bbelb_338780 [Branchiostoma belcheri]|nr:hypothetical protein Bbelb_338780 [Branchiostoma belcheri]